MTKDHKCSPGRERVSLGSHQVVFGRHLCEILVSQSLRWSVYAQSRHQGLAGCPPAEQHTIKSQKIQSLRWSVYALSRHQGLAGCPPAEDSKLALVGVRTISAPRARRMSTCRTTHHQVTEDSKLALVGVRTISAPRAPGLAGCPPAEQHTIKSQKIQTHYLGTKGSQDVHLQLALVGVRTISAPRARRMSTCRTTHHQVTEDSKPAAPVLQLGTNQG